MSYGLGIELAADAVRVATAPEVAQSAGVRSLPPMIFIDEGRVWAGDDAVRLAVARPPGAISDIIGQFTVDRLWLSGGRMLTSDDALRELLDAVLRETSASRSEPPGATTISCPAGWDEPVRQRVVTDAGAVALPELKLVTGLDAEEAAADAALRLSHTSSPTAEATELPVIPPDVRPSPVTAAEAPLEPLRGTRRRQSRLGAVVSALLVGLLVIGVVVAVVDRRHSGKSNDTLTLPSSTPSTSLSSATSAGPSEPATPLTLVLLASSSDLELGVRQGVAQIVAAGGLFGKPVGVRTVAIKSDVALTAGQLVDGGAGALITDLGGAALVSLSSGLGSRNVALCVTSSPQALPQAHLTILFTGPTPCAVLLALAARAANSATADQIARAIRELAQSDGVPCQTFAQCSRLLDAHQPISYTVNGRPVQLATTT